MNCKSAPALTLSMKTAFAFAASLFVTTSAVAQISGGPFNSGSIPGSPSANPTRPDVTVSYNSLRAIDEVISVSNIDTPTIVKGNFGDGLRILVNGTSACGKEFFVDQRDPNGISFYQLGYAGVGHVQPACLEKIEFVWQPIDWNLKEGQSSEVALTIKRNFYVVRGETPPKDIVIRAKIKRSSTPTATRYLILDFKIENQNL